VNRVKLGTIIYIHTHPITPEMEDNLLKEARDLIAKETQVRTEGNDPQEMGIDKHSLFKLFHKETQQTQQEKQNRAKVAGNVVLAANAFQQKKPKKSVSCVLL
jgi:hypothetical protein